MIMADASRHCDYGCFNSESENRFQSTSGAIQVVSILADGKESSCGFEKRCLLLQNALDIKEKVQKPHFKQEYGLFKNDSFRPASSNMAQACYIGNAANVLAFRNMYSSGKPTMRPCQGIP
jgi:hypothetical protein